MLKRLYCQFLIILFFTTQASGQSGPIQFNSPVSPSPNSSSLSKYGDIEVSTYTGIPTIEVPIFNIDVGKNQIPFHLSYHSGGFKVNEESSSIGLGWSLMAGGVITRAKRNMDDLSDRGFYKHALTGSFDGWDKQADMFYFNFLGFNGKFVIDYSNNTAQPYIIRVINEYNDDKIKIQLLANKNWKITDKFGNIYEFNDTEVQNDHTTFSDSGSSDNNDYISSWYLSKVTYSNSEQAVFKYLDGPQIAAVPVIDLVSNNKLLLSAPSCWPRNFSAINLSTTTSNVKVNTKILSEISFPSGKVLFINTHDRTDLKSTIGQAAPRLSSIKIFQKVRNDYNLIRKYNLSHSYSSSSTRENYLSKRLLLTGFSLLDSVSGNSQNYTFQYNSIALPDKDSKDIDHWGFYKGPVNNLNLFGNRNPSEFYVKAGLIESIVYPTKGKTVFSFEINDFSNLGLNLDWTSQKAGMLAMMGAGVRIKSIKNFGNKNLAAVASENVYDYVIDSVGTPKSSGKIMSKIHYYDQFNDNQGVYSCAENPTKPNVITTLPVIIRNEVSYTSSAIPISGNAQGNPIGYDYVTIKTIDGTTALKTVEEYYNASTASLTLYPRVPINNNNMNGLLKAKTEFILKSGLQVPLRKVSFSYQTQNSATTLGKIYGSYPSGFYTYRILSDWITLKDQTETEYGANNFPITRNSTFVYDNITHQKKQEYFKNSNDLNVLTTYKYPGDLVSEGITNPYQEMVNRNMEGVVVQTSNSKNGMFLEASYMDYSLGWPKNSNLILPVTMRTKIGTDSIRVKLRFFAYDKRGKIVTVGPEKGMLTTYLWSFNGQFPIAEIKNARYDQFENTIGSAAIENFSLLPNPSKQDIDAFLIPIRTLLPNAHMTVYSYEPLIGLSSVTPPSQQTTFYEYDSLNRLQAIKDYNKYIIKKFDYNFSNIN